MYKLLERYPFSDHRIQLIEGFATYDGALGDMPDTPHKGIDYILNLNSTYHSFDVYAMHPGTAFRGVSKSWGNFVIIHRAFEDRRYSTVYAHLETIDPAITPLPDEGEIDDGTKPAGTPLVTGHKLGVIGISGWTHGIPQLHLELHEKDLKTNATQKLDPYGLNDRASSGKYPQPGKSLHALDHAWISDLPLLQ